MLLKDSGPFKPEGDLTKAYMDSREMNLGDCERAKRDTLSKKVKAGTATTEEAEALKKISYLSIVYNRKNFENIYKKITNGGNNVKTSGLLFSDRFKKADSLQNKLPGFKQPVIIIAGHQDPGGFMSYEIKLQALKAKLYWIDKAGHFPMFDQPESFYATLFKALNER